MSKVTSKLQVTIPKRIAEKYGIAPGDHVAFVPAGDGIRLVPAQSRVRQHFSPAERLRLFDVASARQAEREKRMSLPAKGKTGRDWKREDLYTRGKPG